MHHYTECGLSYIYLENGFCKETVDGDEYVGIDDVNSLHETIGKFLSDKPNSLSGEEIRFLRVEMNLSQKSLGKLLDVEDQTVARWEKEQTEFARAPDVLLRSLYLESINHGSPVGHLLKVLADGDVKDALERINIREVEKHWQIAS